MVSGSVAPGEPSPPGSDTVRPTADTMPFVTLLVSPSGLPIASTMSPTATLLESANVAGLSPDASLTWMTARSSGGYAPTSVPCSVLAVPEGVTWKVVAEPTTWAFVTMLPLLSNTTPEPRSTLVRMRTTDGSTAPIVSTYADCNELALAPEGVEASA